MKSKVILIVFFSLSSVLFGIFNLVRTQSNNEIYSLLDEYSIAEIRHFYDCNFYSESLKSPKSRILKWDQDILIYLRGDFSDLDSVSVSHVIDVIDDMNLPVKVSMTREYKEANVIMSFKNEVCDSTRIVNGKVKPHTNFLNKKIISGAIAISNCLSGEFRKETIEEEMFQMLGTLSDTYSVLNSKFSQTKVTKYREILSIDKRIIQLLYDPRVPFGLSRRRFENIFESELNLVYDDMEVDNFIANYNLDKSFKYYIKHNLIHLSNNEFVKWNYEKVPVFIDSLIEYDLEQSIVQEIDRINSILNREFLVVSSEMNDYGVHIILTDLDNVETKNYIGIDALRKCIYNSELKMGGYNTEFLFDQLLGILCCHPGNIPSQEDKEALFLFAYSNILPNNYDLSKIVLD